MGSNDEKKPGDSAPAGSFKSEGIVRLVLEICLLGFSLRFNSPRISQIVKLLLLSRFRGFIFHIDYVFSKLVRFLM